MIVGGKLNEENIGVLSARCLVPDKHDAVKPCTLFLTANRIVVVLTGGINPWAVVTVIVAFAVSLSGLLLRNFVLFLGGLGAGIIAGFIIGLADFIIRHIGPRKVRRLNPERILEMSEKNLAIDYKKIVKIEVRKLTKYPGRSDFIPSFPAFQEHKYVIDFVLGEKKHTFILDRKKLQQCLKLLHQFVPETVEIEQFE